MPLIWAAGLWYYKRRRKTPHNGIHGLQRAVIAQLVEQRIRNARVRGSSPFNGTISFVELWCRGLTCLPVTQEIAGSNPVSSAIFFIMGHCPFPHGSVAQLVEQRTENPRVGGSIPSRATIFLFMATDIGRRSPWRVLRGPLAQLAEHLTFNQGVGGSNPPWLTIFRTYGAWRRSDRRESSRRFCFARVRHITLCGLYTG